MNKEVNEVVESFIRMTEKVSNGKINVLNLGSEDMNFYRGEIHIIKMIGDNPNTYASEIARRFNITRSVVSKTIIKLEKRGFINKTNCKNDKKRLNLTLTDKGQAAYNAHGEYHNEYDKPFFDFVENVNDIELKTIKTFLEHANQLIDNHF